MIKNQRSAFLEITKHSAQSIPREVGHYAHTITATASRLNTITSLAEYSGYLTMVIDGSHDRQRLQDRINEAIVSNVDATYDFLGQINILRTKLQKIRAKSQTSYWVQKYEQLVKDIPSSRIDSTNLLFDLDPITLIDDQEDVTFEVKPVRIMVPLNASSSIDFSNLRAYPQDGDWREIQNDPHMRAFHPHVNSDGQICAGDAAGAINNALFDNEYGELQVILQQLLSQYNYDSPYFRLHEVNQPCPRCGAVDREPLVSHDETPGCANCILYSTESGRYHRRRYYHDYNQEQPNVQPTEAVQSSLEEGQVL